MQASTRNPIDETVFATAQHRPGLHSRRRTRSLLVRRCRRHRRQAHLSVKASLRLAFALVLLGTLVIGIIALTQISRLNGSTESIYRQGYVASRAAEELRGNVLRASRSQKMLLTATTAKEREELGADVDRSLSQIAQDQARLQQYIDTADQTAVDAQKRLQAAVAAWSGHERAFVTLVKAQPLDLQQMGWQVGIADVSLLVDTAKLEKLVDELVERRGVAANRPSMPPPSSITRRS